MPIDRRELTQEQIMKAMKCKSADELMTLAKAEGFTITKDEAEAYMVELADCELDVKELEEAAGGGCYCDCGEDRCPQEKCIY